MAMKEKLNHRQLAINRRRFVNYCAVAGLGGTLLPGTLAAVAQDAAVITEAMVIDAARLAGLKMDDEEAAEVAESLNGRRSMLPSYEGLRALKMPNSVAPAIVFNPLPAGFELPTQQRPLKPSRPDVRRPASNDELAFLSVTHLSQLLRSREISSVELTRLYLARLKKYDPLLHCVVTLTEELALRQARRADSEIATGHYRGPLHGIPWGAKDLFAVQGYPTSWGATPYKEQVLEGNAAVYTKLTEAGAVLVAKLTLGALAIGDRWFGGQTKSPWDPENPRRGSSGSSAGPASATAAGLVGFSIGTETRGSIISPSRRCGVSGMRPTFGRVSRTGAMALSWSMDKAGPLCRSAEDCALVLSAINGPDGLDKSVFDVPFNWDASRPVTHLKVGYLTSLIEGDLSEGEQNQQRAARIRARRQQARKALETLRSAGLQLKPIELPSFTDQLQGFILTTEAAAAFDDLFRRRHDPDYVEGPDPGSHATRFRTHRFVPAVEYIQANRARTLMIEEFNAFFDSADIDLFVGSQLGLTNLTGHPEISVPAEFDAQGQPGSLSLTGRLFGDEDVLQLAHFFQQNSDYHLRRPKI